MGTASRFSDVFKEKIFETSYSDNFYFFHHKGAETVDAK